MPTTMQLISAQTLTDNNSKTVSFTNIPQTFTDLKLVVSARSTGSIQWYSVGFNGSTSSYSDKYLIGDGSTSASNSDGSQPPFAGASVDGGNTSNTFSNSETYIPNYTGSNYKSYYGDGVSENNATQSFSGFWADLWSNTAAITSIQITSQGNSSIKFVAGSSFYLYGISSDTTTQNTSGPYAFGGDTITTDGTYWYHTFVNSNAFVPQKNLSNVDYLVVAGGGGGGGLGAGGGAGGLRCTLGATGGGGSLESKLSLTAGNSYLAIIGSGGSAPTSNGTKGFSGSDSSFSGSGITTITSTGGGNGGGFNVDNASTGGSGGGGSLVDPPQVGNGKAGTANQGYAGGNGVTANDGSPRSGGGGGGAGAAGTSGSGYTAGNGGNGVATTISGSSKSYAGGGAGGYDIRYSGTFGTAGTGGGGTATSSGGTAGTMATGGGGGAGTFNGSQWFNAGAGGSGIIILRYAV